METRPKMGEKNCTRAAVKRGRAGRALGGGDEETSSWQWAGSVRVSEASRRVL